MVRLECTTRIRAPLAMTGPLCTHVANACDHALIALPPGAANGLVARIRAGLEQPLRVAIAGRVNSGKSTLVNALLRQRVAPTDVSECTRYVTTYRFGVPERVEAVHRDGSKRAMPLLPDGSLPREPSEPGEEIASLEVHLANEALRDLVLIDTPGLESLNEEFSAETVALLGLDRASEEAVADADALVYVLTSSLRGDEATLLRAFRALIGGSSASALSAVCVLNKADLVDDDGTGDLAAAVALAERFASTLRAEVVGVRPIVSLLAESVDTGRFNEVHAVALRALAEMPDASLDVLLQSVDRFVGAPAAVASSDRADLLAILGMWGIARAIGLVRTGSSTASVILPELRRLAGIETLRAELLEAFARNSDALKANGALAALERIVYSMIEPELADARLELHDAIDAARIAPEMHRLDELRAIQEVASGAVELPGDLELDLRRLVTERTPQARLGLPGGASLEDVQRSAASAAATWKRFRNDGRSSPSQQWVADVMNQSCERVWLDAANSRTGAS